MPEESTCNLLFINRHQCVSWLLVMKYSVTQVSSRVNVGFRSRKVDQYLAGVGGSEIQVPDKGFPSKRIFENTVSTTRYSNVSNSCGCSRAAVTASEYRLGTACLVLISIIPSDEPGQRQAVRSNKPYSMLPSASTTLADKIHGTETAVNRAQ